MEIVVLNSDIARLVLGKFPKKSLKITKNLVIIEKNMFFLYRLFEVSKIEESNTHILQNLTIFKARVCSL